MANRYILKKRYLHLTAMVCGALSILSFPASAFDVQTHAHLSVHAFARFQVPEAYTGGPFESVEAAQLARRQAFQTLGVGAIEEDESPRYLRHFYDPLRLPENAGLGNFSSSLQWATNTGPFSGLFPNEWSLPKGRDYLFWSLTKEERLDRDFFKSKAIRTSGHIMHLIQDLAQPAHVRNDVHADEAVHLVNGLETWVGAHLNELPLLNPVTSPDISQGLRGLWDDDSGAGLAEFTNRHFFSEDTIFTYLHPAADETKVYFGQQNRLFCRKTTAPVVEHFMGEKVLDRDIYACHRYTDDCALTYEQEDRLFRAERQRLLTRLRNDIRNGVNVLCDSPQRFGRYLVWTLDCDDCYRDYARLLVPRAIDYSLAAIKYILRGRLDVSDKHSFHEVSPNSNQFTETVTLKVKNPDLVESMGPGGLTVHYDTPEGRRLRADRCDREAGCAVSQQQLAEGTFEIDFQAPSDLTRLGKDRYLVVFRGKLGAEERSVAATALAPVPRLILVKPPCPARESTQILRVAVLLRGADEGPVTVAYNTSNGSALAGTHYRAKSDTLSFGPSPSQANIEIEILPRPSVNDGVKTFFLQIHSPQGAITHRPTLIEIAIEDDSITPSPCGG